MFKNTILYPMSQHIIQQAKVPEPLSKDSGTFTFMHSHKTLRQNKTGTDQKLYLAPT